MAQANTLTAPDTFTAHGAGAPRHTSLTAVLGRDFDLESWKMDGPFYDDKQDRS